MAAVLERRVTRAAGWSRRFGAFSAALFILSGLSHRYALLETPAFIWVLLIVGTLAIAALLCGAYAFSRIWNHGDIGGRDVGFGTVIALVVLVPFAISGYRGYTRPMLADVSTDLDDPPSLINAARTHTAAMNPIAPIAPAKAKLQADAYPNVTGRRYDLPFDRTLEAVNAVLKRQGWSVYVAPSSELAQEEVTIEALAHTMIFAFPVDVAVRVTDEVGSSYVDMRSASRFGRADLGDNAARIVAFLAELDTEVAGQAGAVPAAQ